MRQDDRRKGEGKGTCSRLLDALGFDMPTCEIILEHADKTFFRFFAQFCTANVTKKEHKQSFIFRRGRRNSAAKKRGQHIRLASERRNRTACVCWVSGARGSHDAANAEYKRAQPTQR